MGSEPPPLVTGIKSQNSTTKYRIQREDEHTHSMRQPRANSVDLIFRMKQNVFNPWKSGLAHKNKNNVQKRVSFWMESEPQQCYSVFNYFFILERCTVSFLGKIAKCCSSRTLLKLLFSLFSDCVADPFRLDSVGLRKEWWVDCSPSIKRLNYLFVLFLSL